MSATGSLCADARCEHPQGWHRKGIGSCLECGCTVFQFQPYPPNYPDSHDPADPPSTEELLGG